MIIYDHLDCHHFIPQVCNILEIRVVLCIYLCVYIYYVRKRIVWREREREILKYLKKYHFFFIKNNE